jgi:protein-tyrosine phosphatase
LIDLHCHILAALDDGALDLADSVAMARAAHSDGIEIVCATPHIRDDHDVRIDELPARVKALQGELDRRGIPVRIATGGEVAQLAVERLSAAHLREVSLDGGGWVLLEPAPGPLGSELAAVVGRLADRGVSAIVAHPERHAGADLFARLRELAGRGSLIQWTAHFIAHVDRGEPGGLVARLVGEGLVHLLASDAHSSRGGRPLRLSEGFARLRRLCPPEQMRWIRDDAPAAILRGERVTVPW